MKNIFAGSLLILFALMCSCQKQDSTTDVQLAQQKAELETRERALDERLNSLDERVSSLDQRVKALAENATANTRLNSAAVQDQGADPAQVQAERDKTMRQVPAEIRSMMVNDLKKKADMDRERQAQRIQSQPGPDKLQSQIQRKLQMSSGAVFPSAESGSQTPSSAVETGSSSPSSATEPSSPTSSPAPQ
jgi:DNA repair exonuclease SbcCD ATPase subunit